MAFQGLRQKVLGGFSTYTVGCGVAGTLVTRSTLSSSSYGLELHAEYFHQAGVVLVSLGLLRFPALKTRPNHTGNGEAQSDTGRSSFFLLRDSSTAKKTRSASACLGEPDFQSEKTPRFLNLWRWPRGHIYLERYLRMKRVLLIIVAGSWCAVAV